MRDLENGNLEIYRRDTQEKISMSVEQLA